MVGFGEVDELEVEAEGSRKLVGGGKIESANAGEGVLEMRGGGGGIGCSALRGFGLAPGDGGAAKRFDGVVEGIAGLLAKNPTEQHAERTDVAA